MPRSASGACSLAEPAFIANTPIVAADANSNNDDIIDMLTDSLSRSGAGGMTAELSLHNDGFTYSTDPNTGMRRTAGDTQAIECGGVDVFEVTPTGGTVNGDLEVTGDFTVDGNPILLIGEVKIWTSTTIPAKWLAFGQTLLRATYPDLWTYAAAEIAAGNTLFTNGNGTTTFTIAATAGYAPVDVDAASTTLPSVTHIGDATGSKSATLAANQIPSLTSINASQTITVDPPVGRNVPSTSGNPTLTSATIGGGSFFLVYSDVANWAATTGWTKVNSISVAYTNASQQVTPLVQPSRAFKFIIYAGA